MKRAVFIFIAILVLSPAYGQSSATTVDELEAFKKSIGRLELVKVLPTVWYEKHHRIGFKRKYWSQMSILTNENDKGFKEELISPPVNANADDLINFIDLIYSDSTKNYAIGCYNPRHGIIVWGHQHNYLGFVEICFECEGIRVTPGLPRPKELPYAVYQKLKQLFKAYGLVDDGVH